MATAAKINAGRKANATGAKTLGKNGFKYREQFGVIVMCSTEKHQAQTFADLRRRGLVCKVVTV